MYRYRCLNCNHRFTDARWNIILPCPKCGGKTLLTKYSGDIAS